MSERIHSRAGVNFWKLHAGGAQSMTVIVCHACDLAQRVEKLAPVARVRCVRCRAELHRTSTAGVDTAIALALTGLVLFIIANAYPLVAFKVNGTTRTTTLTGAALGLYDQGYGALAVLVAITAVLVPLIQILAFLYVLVPVRMGFRAPGQEDLFRVLSAVRPWGMSEVFVLGAIVALVKLSAEAEVSPLVALVAYGLLMFTLTALASVTPTEQLWRWLGREAR
jgi:paraquat-inducible protein A